MASKNVATAADVVATAGSKPYLPADTTISWTPGPITVTSYSKLTIGGQPVISEAKCTFSFVGTQTIPGPPPVKKPVTHSEDLTLSAAKLSTTRLQGGEQQVLRHGDRITSEYGNQLSISSSNKLTSS